MANKLQTERFNIIEISDEPPVREGVRIVGLDIPFWDIVKFVIYFIGAQALLGGIVLLFLLAINVI